MKQITTQAVTAAGASAAANAFRQIVFFTMTAPSKYVIYS
jgi:hypothetical protein